MSEQDRKHWDVRYSEHETGLQGEPGPPRVFASVAHLFPVEGRALDIGCGRGQAAVWLALRGMDVLGVDVSPVVIKLARGLASLNNVSDRCRFEVHDLDLGLPDTPPMDLIICHKFRDARLDRAMFDRLGHGGLLAIAALSQVGSEPSHYRAAPGELVEAFAGLDVLAAGEDEVVSWLIGRRPG